MGKLAGADWVELVNAMGQGLRVDAGHQDRLQVRRLIGCGCLGQYTPTPLREFENEMFTGYGRFASR
ncbi:hypothetical protein BC739_007844 [Kutzneria viridogrisea]|uniref:Uncharacterized protein n=1 Tax=Kutzneria viridogrisea TaxID=47990 RepID=A0ABR6BUJ7_9PSEU|nr:hypothetical protein [Kutzneria viridogrisea]